MVGDLWRAETERGKEIWKRKRVDERGDEATEKKGGDGRGKEEIEERRRWKRNGRD
jgi:hypothetical protein